MSSLSSGCFEGLGGRVGSFKCPVSVVVALRGGNGEEGGSFKCPVTVDE